MPDHKITRFACSSSSTSSVTGTGSTCTAPPGSNVNAVTLPNAAMYWSCFPTGSPSFTISSSHASSASFCDETNSRLYVCSALSRLTVNDDDEPSPLLAGRSATLVSSIACVRCVIRRASRKMGCSMRSTSSTISVFEYERRIDEKKRRFAVT